MFTIRVEISFFKPKFLFFFQLLPKHCAMLISQVVNRKKKEKNKKNILEVPKPGVESYRKTREELTT